jgi:hypothetical protein
MKARADRKPRIPPGEIQVCLESPEKAKPGESNKIRESPLLVMLNVIGETFGGNSRLAVID